MSSKLRQAKKFRSSVSTLGAKSNKRCDRLNIFKKIPVQKNPIVLTGYKRCSDIRFPPNQIEQSPGGPNENGRKVHPPKAKSKSRFWMVIVCSGFHHRRRIGDFFVELSFQCREAYDKTNTLFVCNNTNNVTRNTPKPKRRGNKLEESRIESPN